MHECRFHVLKEFKYKRRRCKKQLELKRKRYLDSAKRKSYQGIYTCFINISFFFFFNIVSHYLLSHYFTYHLNVDIYSQIIVIL